MFTETQERDLDMTEIPVDSVDPTPFQTRMDFDGEKIDEYAEPEEYHPGIIPETSEEEKRNIIRLVAMLRSVLKEEKGER